MTATELYKCGCKLGEGACWHSRRKSFFWVDILGFAIFEYVISDKKVNRWQLPEEVSFVAEADNHYLLVAMKNAISLLNLDTDRMSLLANVEPEIADNRCNDGAVDRKGRLWIGTMQMECEPCRGALYFLDSNMQLRKKLPELSISNGIAWTNDNQTMYHIDTARNAVCSYDFDAEKANIFFKKVVVDVPREYGSPDGMCIDENGMLWIAHWGGFGIYQWNPANGKMLQKIDVPAPHVTSCAFGGEYMDQLFITTAYDGLTGEQKNVYPGSGNVFVASPGVKGVSNNIFRLVPETKI